MEITRHVACICEGTAEEVIMEKLLQANLLVFSGSMLLDEKLIRTRSGENFQRQYLNKDFGEKVTVLRILDSRREKFKVSKAYEDKIAVVYNIVTSPEIEILIVLCEGKYAEWKRSKKKPSKYCSENLGMSGVKSRKFLEDYFSDIDVLIKVIREYRRVSDIPDGELCLFDLLKQS